MLPSLPIPRWVVFPGIARAARTASSATEGEGLYSAPRLRELIRCCESRIHSCLGGLWSNPRARRSLVQRIPGASDDFHIPMQIWSQPGSGSVRTPGDGPHPRCCDAWQELERKAAPHVSLFHDAYYLRDGLKPWKSAVWWQFWSHNGATPLRPECSVG